MMHPLLPEALAARWGGLPVYTSDHLDLGQVVETTMLIVVGAGPRRRGLLRDWRQRRRRRKALASFTAELDRASRPWVTQKVDDAP